MGKPHTFNLKPGTTILLNELGKRLETTKTNIVERAIIHFADEIEATDNKYMKYAGRISAKTSKKMLDAIYKDRDSKSIIDIS